MAISTTVDKRRNISNQRHQQDLLPGLPNDIAQLCLSLLKPSLLFSVSTSWRSLIYTQSFPPFPSIYALLSHNDSIHFSSFDPISSTWHHLPPPPLNLLLRHPSFISRNLPIQSVSDSGNLIVLAATAPHLVPALSRPLIFNPLSKSWSFGPPLTTPRRWCAAGTSRGVVYVASGIGSQYRTDVARSVERWNCFDGQKWEKIEGLKDGRFCRDAIDAVGWRGKLCLVNVKAKEGVVYDVKTGVSEEMPEGMVAGWSGPATAIDEDSIFVVDELKGVLRKYDPVRDEWVEIIESDRLKGATQISGGYGRVCVVSGGEIVVVDVASSPARTWTVEPPPNFEAVAVHILPRMSCS